MTESRRILLFDDDYESMLPLKLLLEFTKGYIVELTAEPNVIERLQQEKFDLLCLDVMIHPETFDSNDEIVENLHFAGVNWQRTGLELLKRLRTGELATGDDGTRSDTPVIVLSAVADLSEYEAQIKQWRSNTRHMEKPFDPEELVKLISDLLQGSPT